VNPPAFLPLTISWNLTQKCNLACAHCYIDASAKSDTSRELDPKESIELLHTIAKVNSQAVLILTGGEPLLRKDIYDLVRESTKLGFWTVLGSHGGLLTEATADRLAQAGLKGVGVSIDSLDPVKHDRFRGIDKAWANTVGALPIMRKRGLPFLIETTLTTMNRSELAGMAAFAVEQGATALNVFFLVPTGRGANLNDLTPQQYEESLVELAGLQKEYAGRLLLNAKCAPHYRRVLWEGDPESIFVRTFSGGGCPAGTYYCRIGPEGDLTPCPYMPLSVGNVRKTPFDELWKTSKILKEFREEKRGGRCGDCEFTELCGGCRCRAYALTGDYLAEDPSCTYEPGKYNNVRIPLPPEQTYGATVTLELRWEPEAEKRIENVPYFARGIVRKAVEKAARKRGVSIVTEALMAELRKKMEGRFPLPKS